MCGIGGIMMYPKERSEMELSYIRDLVSELAIQNQARGRDATGVAIMNKDGAYKVLKNDVKAEDFTNYDSWNDTLEANISMDTQSILIHTRASTKGEPTNNDNNHPIETNTAIGVHNGMIWNDDELFESEKIFRLAEVDSEVIFRLADTCNTVTKATMKTKIAEKLSGVFAVAFMRKDKPNMLNYLRNNNPTTFMYIEKLNIIVFASIKGYLENAIEDTNTISSYYAGGIQVEKDELNFFEPKENTIMQFDMSDNSPVAQLNQKPMSFEDNYGGFYGSSWYGYDSGSNSKKVSETIYSYITEINDRFSNTEFSKIMSLLEELESNEWNRGYKSGRESLGEEIMVKTEESFKRGYDRAKEEQAEMEHIID